MEITKETPQKTNMEITNPIEMAEATSHIVNVFLCEYCEVEGITEDKLKDFLCLYEDPLKGTLEIRNNDSVVMLRSTIVGVMRVDGFTLNHDIYLADRVKYPKTYSSLQEGKINQVNKAREGVYS